MLFLFEQVENLYFGFLSLMFGGQVVIVVNLVNLDFDVYLKFKIVLDNVYIVDLELGDGLYYLSMWWYEVEVWDRFNVMVNFWWMVVKLFFGNFMDILLYGMLSLCDKFESEKVVW